MCVCTSIFQVSLAWTGQSGVGALATGAQLETPHVTNHCCGVECLLQRKRNESNTAQKPAASQSSETESWQGLGEQPSAAAPDIFCYVAIPTSLWVESSSL